MRALWLEDGKLRLRQDLPEPRPGDDEVTIAVRRAGICGTDLALVDGYAGLAGVPGHEFVGEVIDGPAEWRGRRVVGEINVACATCEMCLRGYPAHCANRNVVGIRGHQGVFAERVAMSLTNLHEVPEGIADELAALTEPLAAAFEIVEQVAVGPEDKVLVVGAGRLGVLVTKVLAGYTPNVSVLARDPRRAARFDAGTKIVDAVTGTYDIVVECSGNPQCLALALEGVRPRGTVVLKSTYTAPVELDANAIVVNEISVLGSRCGPFNRAIGALERTEVDLADLSFDLFGLEEFEQAFERAMSPDVYKVFFDPSR